jgi:hypothetical protein
LNEANERNKILSSQNNTHEVKLQLKDKSIRDLSASNDEYQKKLISYEGDENQIDRIPSVEKCDEIIHLLSNTLQKLDKKKDNIYRKEIESSLNCLICREKKKTIAFIPCWHLCVCQSCFQENYHGRVAPQQQVNGSMMTANYSSKCPVCREGINGHQVIYG